MKHLQATLLLLLLVATATAAPHEPFYVIAHMANTPDAVDWALNTAGANALEMDLRFDPATGAPDHFLHGGVCDCVCSPYCDAPVPEQPDVCAPLGCACNVSTPASAMFAALAAQKKALALLIIDSKVDGALPEATLAKAGRAVVAAVNGQLFAKGYAGNVVVGCAKPDAFTYLQNVAAAAAAGPYADRTFVGMDQLGGKTSDAVCGISLISRLATKARSFGTGITACVPGNYDDAIATGVLNRDKSEPSVSTTYIWTLDKNTSMLEYIKLGVTGVMTNRPNNLHSLVLGLGLRLAQPGDKLPLATSTEVVGGDPTSCGCDCDYHPGGCRVSYPAPLGKACKCVYQTLQWTCHGTVVECSDKSSPFCKLPDSSPESCALGGGDCLGYK